MVGIVALACWSSLRKAQGKTALPRIRRQMSGPVKEDGEIGYDDATTFYALVDLYLHGPEAAEPQYKGGKR
jgi:hypothetical protein